MSVPTAAQVAGLLDERLASSGFPDYPPALNGLQLDHQGPVRKVVAAVDFSRRTIDAAIAAGGNLLLLHHGMFWGGNQRLVGHHYERLRDLLSHDIAVYASHLPLDAHLELGNCAQLARRLGLTVSGRFGQYQGVPIGVMGEADLPLMDLLSRAHAFSVALGGGARASHEVAGQHCHRWAVITGAGADATTLREARACGIDTLIVGEGPHHTTVDAAELGVTVIYAGHYATETLGVQALLELVGREFGLPTEFLYLPTGS
ncbi:MAG: Nif3-like dinuclear metal center hexameric protein [Gemmatimonadetes bacterium]|nr:Nif3-like dinuclear metal center hexameric protein [Gemmatimonadota bacterium]